MYDHCETLIVGAGIAGLVAARGIVGARGIVAAGESGSDVIVVDKSRGVGGRMATRRFSGARFDHGAQFISVRTEAFGRLVQEWTDAGIVKIWSHGFADGLTGDGSLLTCAAGGGARAHTPARDGHPRYCARDGMTSIAKHLAEGLDIRLGTQVTAIRRVGTGWQVDAENGGPYRASSVVLTAPVPQSLALLAGGGVALEPGARRTLESLGYAPCIALLARSNVATGLPAPGVLRRANADVEWIADNAEKGITDAGPALTVHCGVDFSREYYDEDDETVYRALVARLSELIPVDFSSWQIKRWRFSRPTNPLSVGSWTAGVPDGLVLAGDAFAGARVEGAALSGLAAAAALRPDA